MKEELKELISKHLPSLAAGEMSKYIEQAEKDKSALEYANIVTKTLREANTDLQQKLDSYISREHVITNKEASLAELENKLNTKEFNLKVAELTYQLETEKQSKRDIYTLVNTFVANTRAIEVMTRNSSNNMGADYYNGQQIRHVIGTYETSKTEHKETKDPKA